MYIHNLFKVSSERFQFIAQNKIQSESLKIFKPKKTIGIELYGWQYRLVRGGYVHS